MNHVVEPRIVDGLVGDQTTPVTWQLANEPNAVRRLVRKLEREVPGPARMCVDDYLLAIDHLEARLIEFDRRLAEIAATEPYREPVGWLRCVRGIDTLTAILILAEEAARRDTSTFTRTASSRERSCSTRRSFEGNGVAAESGRDLLIALT